MNSKNGRHGGGAVIPVAALDDQLPTSARYLPGLATAPAGERLTELNSPPFRPPASFRLGNGFSSHTTTGLNSDLSACQTQGFVRPGDTPGAAAFQISAGA